MRIATANAFDNTIAQLTRRQADLAKQQERLSSGKQVLKPSDDPVAATLAETAKNKLARNEADLRALKASRTSLEQVESGLGESSDLIQQVRELFVTAGNGAFTDSEREDVARQLESLRERLVAVANRTDTNGRTLFGGLGGSSTPFVDTYTASGATVVFQGQRGQAAAGNTSLPSTLDGDAIWMRVPQGNGTFTVSLGAGNTGSVRTDMGEVSNLSAVTGDAYQIAFADVGGQMQYSITNTTTGLPVAGQTGMPYQSGQMIAFDGLSLTLKDGPAAGDTVDINPVSASTDLFKVVQNAIDALRVTGTGANAQRTQALTQSLTELDSAHDRVLLARGRAGEWLNRADSLDSLLGDRSAALKIEKSNLEDLDLIQGISDFQTQQTALDAAIKAYAQVQKLSLFSAI
ncbi:flagellar hook-associated protein FlgL [Hydrogenophaga sp.]|uniref:flagellar hook-associated protein FlgL n=1 Tax=Hydrogenophaga sp. TaxID=1904254 RepID=UPI0035B45822